MVYVGPAGPVNVDSAPLALAREPAPVFCHDGATTTAPSPGCSTPLPPASTARATAAACWAGTGCTLKFTLEMSKKTLPTASTFTRAVEVGLLGTVMVSVPSLAVEADSTTGNVRPPSVDRLIFTLAVLM